MPGDFPASFPICRRGDIQCCSFSVCKLSYQYMALDETMKTILIYVWRSKCRNSLWSGLPKKMGKSKDRPWSQVNEEKLDVERDSLPAQDNIQQKTMTSCKDLLEAKKIEMTLYSIMESISHLIKIARTYAKSENPNCWKTLMCDIFTVGRCARSSVTTWTRRLVVIDPNISVEMLFISGKLD